MIDFFKFQFFKRKIRYKSSRIKHRIQIHDLENLVSGSGFTVCPRSLDPYECSIYDLLSEIIMNIRDQTSGAKLCIYIRMPRNPIKTR